MKSLDINGNRRKFYIGVAKCWQYLFGIIAQYSYSTQTGIYYNLNNIKTNLK